MSDEEDTPRRIALVPYAPIDPAILPRRQEPTEWEMRRAAFENGTLKRPRPFKAWKQRRRARR